MPPPVSFILTAGRTSEVPNMIRRSALGLFVKEIAIVLSEANEACAAALANVGEDLQSRICDVIAGSCTKCRIRDQSYEIYARKDYAA